MKCWIVAPARASHLLRPLHTSTVPTQIPLLLHSLLPSPPFHTKVSVRSCLAMPASQFLTLFHASSRSSIPKRTRPVFYNPIKKFGEMSKGGNGRLVKERAPSTAEEFQRVAEEKAREAQQGTAGQTTDKTCEGTEEATKGDSKVGSVKNRHKDNESATKNRRRGD